MELRIHVHVIRKHLNAISLYVVSELRIKCIEFGRIVNEKFKFSGIYQKQKWKFSVKMNV